MAKKAKDTMGGLYAADRIELNEEDTVSKSQPPLQVVVWVGPHKGRLHARPKGRVSQALLLVRL